MHLRDSFERRRVRVGPGDDDDSDSDKDDSDSDEDDSDSDEDDRDDNVHGKLGSMPPLFPSRPSSGLPESSSFPPSSITSTSNEVDVMTNERTIPVSHATSTSDSPITMAKLTPIESLPIPMTSDSTPAAATQGVGNKSSTAIGGAVGGAVASVVIFGIVVVVCMRKRARRNREHRRRWRQNFTVTALPAMTAVPGNSNYPRRVGGKNREMRHSGPPPMADDQRVDQVDSEALVKLNMLIERAARSSPGPAVDGQSGGTDLEVLAKLDMIMERVARLEEDRDREEEEPPPDYASNRSH
ncbi:hypothetical protein PQX77_017749 [Marasmius sp. AFHP31]|nr:hypothetical protein PQX77_017749 [Marasmius sp. AFHP31]